MNWLRKNYLIFIGLVIIGAILMIDLNPDYTFFNKSADSIGYAYSAEYLYPAYHTSAPLYLILGHFFITLIHTGSVAWRFGLLSVLSTLIASAFVYFTLVKLLWDKRNAKYYALLGMIAYGTSALVISQSTICNTYPLVTMLAIGAYYFSINKKWKLTALFIGAGLAVHLLGVLVFLIFFIGYKELRKNWKAWAIALSFGLLYAYIPLTTKNAPQMWLPNDTNAVWAVITDTYQVIRMLVGTISIWDIPKRVTDTIGIVGLSVGIVTVIPIVYYIHKKKIYRTVIFWLICVPIALFISELDMNTFDYTMVSIPFLIITGMLGLQMLETNKYWKPLAISIVLAVVALGTYNTFYFDLGKNLDKNLTASKLYYTEFAKIPDGAIFMPNWGWEWEAIYKYNKDYNKHIYPLGQDMLNSWQYRAQLEKDGIKVIASENPNLSVASKEMARSVVELNDNVWTTVTTDPYTFDSYVVPANHDVSLIPMPDLAIIEKNKVDPGWRWIPSSPYLIMTTQLFEVEWSNVVFSNKNLLLMVGAGSAGYIVYWILFIFPKRRKSDK